MAGTATAKLRRRAEHAESMVIGMGFLLAKLQARYGADFGDGIGQQVRQAIQDYRELERSIAARDTAMNCAHSAR